MFWIPAPPPPPSTVHCLSLATTRVAIAIGMHRVGRRDERGGDGRAGWAVTLLNIAKCSVLLQHAKGYVAPAHCSYALIVLPGNGAGGRGVGGCTCRCQAVHCTCCFTMQGGAALTASCGELPLSPATAHVFWHSCLCQESSSRTCCCLLHLYCSLIICLYCRLAVLLICTAVQQYWFFWTVTVWEKACA
jgi:hypothetical protein